MFIPSCAAGKKLDEKNVFSVLAVTLRTTGTFNKIKRFEIKSLNVDYYRLFNKVTHKHVTLYRRWSILFFDATMGMRDPSYLKNIYDVLIIRNVKYTHGEIRGEMIQSIL